MQKAMLPSGHNYTVSQKKHDHIFDDKLN